MNSLPVRPLYVDTFRAHGVAEDVPAVVIVTRVLDAGRPDVGVPDVLVDDFSAKISHFVILSGKGEVDGEGYGHA